MIVTFERVQCSQYRDRLDGSDFVVKGVVGWKNGRRGVCRSKISLQVDRAIETGAVSDIDDETRDRPCSKVLSIQTRGHCGGGITTLCIIAEANRLPVANGTASRQAENRLWRGPVMPARLSPIAGKYDKRHINTLLQGCPKQAYDKLSGVPVPRDPAVAKCTDASSCFTFQRFTCTALHVLHVCLACCLELPLLCEATVDLVLNGSQFNPGTLSSQ